MQIWVDADSCPGVIRQILVKASLRTKVALTFVANQPVATPRSSHIKSLQVSQGFDVADDEIVRRIAAGDFLVTSDIPLAAEAIAKGAEVVSFRGERFDPDTIGQTLNLRDFMDTMRSSGIQQSGGPPPLGQRERQQFAQHLDRWLQQGLARQAREQSRADQDKSDPGDD